MLIMEVIKTDIEGVVIIEPRIFKDANIASVTGAKTFSFADWPADPSGLNSAVRLIPVRFDE